MEDKFDLFVEILEKSVEKHGTSKTLTLGHLLNLAKIASKTIDKRNEEHQRLVNSIEPDLNN